MERRELKMVVIGASAGGLRALIDLLVALPPDFRPAVVIVQHIGREVKSSLSLLLGEQCRQPVKEIEDKMVWKNGGVFVAPANYHVLVEEAGYFSLSVEPEVNFSRPSIDVLFESAGFSLGDKVAGVILSGANQDGAAGLQLIQNEGGYTMIQDPALAEFRMMPGAAMERVRADFVGSAVELGGHLRAMTSSVA